MNKSYLSLYSILFMSMLETDSNNSFNMYINLDLSCEEKRKLLEGTALVLGKNCQITKEMADKVHFLYDRLLCDYPNQKVKTVESYNRVKGVFNQNKLDNKYQLIYEEIIQREFGIYNENLFCFYIEAAKDFYIFHHEELMQDIAFDYHVINYLTHPFMELDNKICFDKRFIKSLRYIVNLDYENLDYELYLKIKMTLKYIGIAKPYNFTEKIKFHREAKKILKRMDNYNE